MNFGYGLKRPRLIDMDNNDMLVSKSVLGNIRELNTCIACGGCTATCTAGNFTEFNLRKTHTVLRRGEYRGIYEQLSKCMLCGKCRLVCPRGINTRGMVMVIKQRLGEY